MRIRKAAPDDIDLLIRLRMDFFLEDGAAPDAEALGDTARQLRDYFAAWIQTDGFHAYIAEEGGEVRSAAFLSVVQRPPRPAASSCLVGTVYNVYTYPEHRGKGYARAVMQALMDEAAAMGIAYLDLLATDAGKPLYEKLGFERPSHTYMRMKPPAR